MNLVDLDTFVCVAQNGNLSRAARALGVPKSTVSRRVARLEGVLGVPLLRRQARSVSLTDRGRELSRRCAPALRELGDIERALVEPGEATGTLRVTASPDFGITDSFGDLLAGFGARWPGVVVDVELTSRVVDLIEEGFDLAFRPSIPGLTLAPGLMSRQLLESSVGLYASPDYIAASRRVRRPADLSAHRCLTLRHAPLSSTWKLHPDRGGDPTPVAVEPVVVSNDFTSVVSLARGGAGIAAVPAFIADEYEHRGELVRVLPRWHLGGGGMALIWPASRSLVGRVDAFVRYVTELNGAGSEAPKGGR